jgi:hypothetical protein
MPLDFIVVARTDLLGLKEDHPTVTTFTRLKISEKAVKIAALFGDGETQGFTAALLAPKC